MSSFNKSLPTLTSICAVLTLTGCIAPNDNYKASYPQDNYSQPQPAYGMGDAKVAGTDYHATGNIPCSPGGSCPFGVKREGNGNGMVTVTKPDGRTRTIFFSNGRATGYDESQADPGKFSASKQGDVNFIQIGQERYEIFDAIIWGG